MGRLSAAPHGVGTRTGDDLGLLQYPAPTLEPGDEVTVADGGSAVVTRIVIAPVETKVHRLLEVTVVADG